MAFDDRQLLRRTHAGHEPSARALWNEHAGWMRSYAGSVLGGRRDLADDVVQSVFCRVLGLDRKTVRKVRDVRPWLARATRFEALNQLRAAGRAGRREATHQPQGSPEPHAEVGDLAQALASIPRRHREVIHLRHVLGLTVDQTARALSIPRGTVSSRTDAALARLRRILEQQESPDRPTRRTTPSGAADHAHAG